MRFGECEFLSKLVGLLEIFVAFAREAGDDIGADGNAGNESFGSCNDGLVTTAVVAAGHAAQNSIRAALHGQVEVATHARILPVRQPLQAKIFGFQRGDADARYLGLTQQSRDQISQVTLLIVLGMVIAQVNACQHDLLIASTHLTLHMFDDGYDTAAARLSTYIRDDAIGAAIIAAILHFHLHTRAREYTSAC